MGGLVVIRSRLSFTQRYDLDARKLIVTTKIVPATKHPIRRTLFPALFRKPVTLLTRDQLMERFTASPQIKERLFLEAWDARSKEMLAAEQAFIKSLRAVLVYSDDKRIQNASIDPTLVEETIPALQELKGTEAKDNKALQIMIEHALDTARIYLPLSKDRPEAHIEMTPALKAELDLRAARRYFANPSGADIQSTLAFGERVAGMIATYFGTSSATPVYSGIPSAELQGMFKDITPPAEPTPLPMVLGSFLSKVAAHNMFLANPRYFGHMLTYSALMAIYGDSLTSMLNPNEIGWEVGPATTNASIQTMQWMASLVGFPRGVTTGKGRNKREIKPGGTFTAGGTIANMSALLVARNKALNDYFAKLGRMVGETSDIDVSSLDIGNELTHLDVTKNGLWGAIQTFLKKKGIVDLRPVMNTRFVVLTSAEAHYSLAKMGGSLGIGAENVLPIPVDSSMKMDVKALRAQIEKFELESRGTRKTVIVAVVANAGTTASGNIDPIDEIGTYCRGKGIWFHVDAAFGGGILLSEKHKRLLKGIEHADSVTIDPHKWFFMPYALGAALFKDEQMLRHYLKSSAPYVVHEDALPTEPDLGGMSIQGSMRAASLKLWLTMQAMGTQLMGSIVDHNIQVAKHLETRVKANSELEAMNPVELDLLCFRYVPKELRTILDQAVAHKDFKLIGAVNRALNEINIRLQRRVQDSGKGWFSRHEMANNPYRQFMPTTGMMIDAGIADPQAQKRVLKGFTVETLRAVIMNPYTDNAHVDAVLKDTMMLARGAYEEWKATARLFAHLPGYIVR